LYFVFVVLKSKVGIKSIPSKKEEVTKKDPDALNFEDPIKKKSKKKKEEADEEDEEEDEEKEDDDAELDEEEHKKRKREKKAESEAEESEEPKKKTSKGEEIHSEMVAYFFVPEPTDEEIKEVNDPEQLNYPRGMLALQTPITCFFRYSCHLEH
jgi:DNA polymerase sigma